MQSLGSSVHTKKLEKNRKLFKSNILISSEINQIWQRLFCPRMKIPAAHLAMAVLVRIRFLMFDNSLKQFKSRYNMTSKPENVQTRNSNTYGVITRLENSNSTHLFVSGQHEHA